MDDLISRQAMKNMITNHWSDFSNAANYRTALACVDAVPTVTSTQPERKRGKWIYNSPVTMKCNQCGLVIKDWDWHRFKYCPNCRAEMEIDEQPTIQPVATDINVGNKI